MPSKGRCLPAVYKHKLYTAKAYEDSDENEPANDVTYSDNEPSELIRNISSDTAEKRLRFGICFVEDISKIAAGTSVLQAEPSQVAHLTFMAQFLIPDGF